MRRYATRRPTSQQQFNMLGIRRGKNLKNMISMRKQRVRFRYELINCYYERVS
jgi:hypothetical protein